MSSSSAKKAIGAESEEDTSNSVVEDSNSVSSKPEEDNMPRGAKKKGSDTSTSTTNDPSSTSATATVAKVVTGQPTSQSSELPSFADATAAAAPPVPLREKKPRKAGFREQFLQKLRVMLDRESQKDSTIVQWSTDGNSFIISDQTQFEADIIPTYFDNPIVFASFLSKLYRWGFSRLSSRQTGRFEFRSPTFRRLGADSAPAAAAVNNFSNAGGGASTSIQVQQQQHPNQPSSSLLQQVMPQINQPPPRNPPPSQADAIAELISNFQRSSQQPLTPSQQSVLNQNSNQPNNTDATGIVQCIVGSSIQMQQQRNQSSSSLLQQVMAQINQPPPPNPPQNQADAIADLISRILRQRSSQQPSIPSQHSAMNHQLNVNLNLQPFQQRQNPNPTMTMNLLNTALSILVESQTPSASEERNTGPYGSLRNVITNWNISEHKHHTTGRASTRSYGSVQSLLMLIHRVCDDERQRRVQADAVQNAIIANVGQILGLGSGGGNPTGMTISVPHNIAHQAHQGIPSASAGSLNFQANPIAAILQAARRSCEAGGQLEEVSPQTEIGPVDDDDNDGNDEGKDDHDGRPLSQKKRKCPDDGHGDDDNSLRKKKK